MCIQRSVSSHGPQYYYAAQCAAGNSIVPLLWARTEKEKQPGNGLNPNFYWLNLYCSGFVNYRENDGILRHITAGFGNQASRLIAKQSRQHHMETSTIFDAAVKASPGNGGKLLHGSRKTIASTPAINHRHKAGTECSALYLLASIALRTAAIWRVRVPVKGHLWIQPKKGAEEGHFYVFAGAFWKQGRAVRSNARQPVGAEMGEHKCLHRCLQSDLCFGKKTA